MGIVNNILAGASGQQGYLIANSLRFQSASSQYLSRTPAVAGNQQKFTWSGWVKRGALGSNQTLISTSASLGSNSGVFQLAFTSNNTLEVFVYSTPTTYGDVITTQVFRDPSAWYHIVVTVDTTQATAANRIIVYVNGVQVTSYSTATYPSQNFNCYLNGTTPTYLGGYTASGNPAPVFDGYMAEVNFIDGQALTPSSFGETDALTGVWVAKRYTGTYGTNGFYLKFNDGTSTTTLGQDRSGNANNWTLTNFTRSAGVSDCWMYDVPSGNGSPSATQPSSNYAVMNPLAWVTINSTVTNGNLTWTTNTASGPNIQFSSIKFPSSGKWYIEFAATQVNIGSGLGYGSINISLLSSGSLGWLWWVYSSPFYQIYNGSTYTTIPTISSGDIIMLAIDMDAGKVWYGQNGTWLLSGNPATGTNMSTAFTFTANRDDLLITLQGRTGSATNIVNVNFGQRSFAYTPPSGFKALCTANLPAATIKKGNQYMDATLYTGTGSSQTITNAGAFKPDFVWMKGRSNVRNNNLYDSVRGTTKELNSNTTGAETTNATGLTAFNSNGWTIGSDGGINTASETYVGWQWQAGQGTTSSNTNGSITSTVSVNATAGFSIAKGTTPASGTYTVGHGLGVAPAMVIFKDSSNAGNAWVVYHKSVVTTTSQYLSLNSTAALGSAAGIWGSALPTSTVWGSTVGVGISANSNFISYNFAEIAGFSKFGSYTGNGSTDGPFVYLGFRPKYVMIKRTDAIGDWIIMDTSRNTYNSVISSLAANTSGAESNYTAGNGIDYLSNGFKLRDTGAGINGSANNFIYMAFAENPFNISNAR